MNLKQWRRALSILVSGALIMQLLGCGYLLHPERRGQRGGNIDPGIAILDGVGLLLFIIPGVIAFAVDFTTGTIYYPAGRRTGSSKMIDIGVLRLDPNALTQQTICQKVHQYTECPRNFTIAEAKITHLNEIGEIENNLEKAMRSGYQIN